MNRYAETAIKRLLWSAVVVLTVTALLCGGTPAMPVRADTETAPPAPGGDWKPASERSWWDRLTGKYDGEDSDRRKIAESAVPRYQPQPAAERMRPAKRVKELAGRRTANAKVFELADGRREAEVAATPIHYRGKDGDWREIDTTVRTTGRSGFAFGNESNSYRSFFGDKPEDLVRFETGDGSVTLGAAALRPGAPKAKDDTVSYPAGGAAPGTRLNYQVTPDALKESIVLAAPPKRPADAAFTFTAKVTGLRAWQRPDGAIAFYRGDFDGPPAFVMPKPFMTDSATDPASPYGKTWSDKVSQTMSWDGDKLTVTVRADQAWLADPKRAYPVTIDPTIRIAPPPSTSQDVMITSDSPASNFDASWRLSAGTSSSGVARSLLKFPLTGIPSGTPIDSAQLQVYYDQNIDSSNTTSDVTIEAHRATAAWDETTATWNNANAITGELGSNTETVDDGDAGKTAMNGEWPSSTNTAFTQYAVNRDYLYNKNTAAGETYAWTPRVTEDGTYRVDVHYVPASDRATNAPYTVNYQGGSKAYTVDQTAADADGGGVWKTLGSHPFLAGTTGKITLGDGPASASTAVIADAVRLTKEATQVKKAADDGSHWHSFSVRDIVQGWVNGANANNGFVLKAKDETLDKGGPRYEGSLYTYNGESATYPRLVVSYGRPGVAVHAPTTIHATGAELSWPAYADPSAAAGDDIAEYQVHRSVFQTFTPSAATLVAPVALSTRAYTDTSALPTPADSAEPFGNLYYYMVAVKTKDGQIVPGPTQIARLPKAGRVVKIYQGDAQDTTLSSAQPDANQDVLAGQPWLSVGNNSGTYGKTRAALKFPALTGIPSGARVLDAQVQLWGMYMSGSAAATYALHALNRDFAETTATWNKASATTSWTTAGGDYNATIADTYGGITNDPYQREWTATGIVQGWINDPASNKGVLLKLANETTPAERALFLSNETEETQLRPQLKVTYIEKTADSTYFAPYTPARMIPGDQYTVDVTLTNTTTTTWKASERVLSYRWTLPDGTDVTNGGNQLQTTLPKDVVPGDTVTVKAALKTPIQSDSGNKRTEYILHWDLFNKATGQFLSQSDGIASLDQDVAVEDPTSDQLGLEKFYQYAGKSTGAGSSIMSNLFSGNSTWSYSPFNHPGRGISTFVRMTYNSQDTSASSMGFGWSLQTSTLMRLGSPLDFHPNPNPTTVTYTDGDGTSHTFSWDTDANEWKSPKGVHIFLQRLVVCDNKTEESRAWVMTRPDRTQFFFDCDGYMSAIVDKNGNTAQFSYERRNSNNKPIKFLKYVTDSVSRQTLTLDYFEKGQAYTFINDSGAEVSDANLTNPFIIDQVESITDIAGRKITFTYSDKGLMAKMVDGAGSAQPKVFKFGYDATQGNKNVKLVKVTDPRGNPTSLAYYDPPGDDPKFHWWAKNITDRLGGLTSFAYTDPDAQQGSEIQTVVTDAESHATTYRIDGFGRPTQLTNAKQQVTKLAWDADNNVTRLEENNGAFRTWKFDQKTGYPLEIKDAEANKNDTPGTTLAYQTGLNGHLAELTDKTSPEGRRWHFGYDLKGNLTSVTDPAGTATATANDFTVTYEYDGAGLLAKATDANGNPTTYPAYDPVGYPTKIVDANGRTTQQLYDSRGNVTDVIDAKLKKVTQAYDIFGRTLERRIPKDQDKGEFITVPAPEYDANDNKTKSTAPNGAISTSVYDQADEPIATTEPPDTTNGPERKTTFTYDKVGNALTQVEPKGNLPNANPADFTTRLSYDEIYQTIGAMNPEGNKVTFGYDDVGNKIVEVDPRKNATVDPSDFTSKSTYDLDHRLLTETDAAGFAVRHEYDRDGKESAVSDKEGNKTLFTLDVRGLVAEAKVPHSSSGTINYRTTRYEYDQAGNKTKTITPRGVETTDDPDDFVSQTVYDKLNRVVEQIYPFDRDDSRYNKPEKVTYTYDEVGNQIEVSAPPSEGQSVRNVTKSEYFDNGWVKSSTDPWNIATSYEYNAIGKQINATVTPGGGAADRADRVMTWDYYPDGKLKSRSDDGVPVGRHVALVDDSDFNNAGSIGGTWTSANAGTGFQGYDYAAHAAGTGASGFVWNLVTPQDGDYEVFVRYPAISGAAPNASYKIDHSGGSTTKTVDQTTRGGEWVSLGRFAFAEGNSHRITLSDQASGGTVLADAVKLVRDTSSDPPDTEKKTFSYEYDVNGNQTKVTDDSSGALVRTYDLSYDRLNRTDTVLEKKPDGGLRNTTSYDYDENGNPVRRAHDNVVTTFEYDPRDLLSTVTNTIPGLSGESKTTKFTYTGREEVLKETRGNGNTVDYEYFLDGLLRHQVEKKGTTVVGEYATDYNANGNQTKNTTKVMNADNHSAYLNNTYDFTYDPRDRIAKVVKSGDNSATETYTHDANDNVIAQTVADTTTNYKYDRNRLLTATAVGGATSTYNYDPYGRLDTVTQNAQIAEKYVYDGFDRTKEHRAGSGASAKTTKFVYDPMDRTLSRTKNAGDDDEKTTTYNYLGTTEDVVSEEVDGNLDRSYYWAATGSLLSQITHKDSGREHAFHGFNPHGDVTYLTDDGGDAKATYGYTAYGSDDTKQFTGVDKPDPANPDKEPYNTYRYSAKKFDEATGNYDMGARDYDPGLNRFLTRDMFNGALDDMALASDPFTGNRYAFAGGNPISNIELDGHLFGLSLSDIGHAALDVVGLIPVVGEVADVANGIWYLAEGNYVDAALSLTSAIPLAGYAATAAKGARYGMKGAKALNKAENIAETADTVNDVRRNADNLPTTKGKPDADTPGGTGAPGTSGKPASGTPSGGTPPKAAHAAPPKQPAPASRADAPNSRASCPINSFVAGTKVLLADGTSKPIEQIKDGDSVRSTDPNTGKTSNQKVLAAFQGTNYDHLVQIAVDTDGAKGNRTGVIVATEHHLFWDPAHHTWTRADQLTPSTKFRTPAGAMVRVLHAYHTFGHPQVYDLTIATTHTFYVESGATAVLVHNAGCGPHRGPDGRFAKDPNAPPKPTKPSTHGNSRNSTATNYLYVLEDANGGYLKTGITQNPAGRYSAREMVDMGADRMRVLTSGSRSDMLDLERYIVERWPGPLNKEPWAGSMMLNVLG